MLHLLILLMCHLSYIQLGKMDSTIPKPKPHLTLTCFVKLLVYIPFNVGLQLTYFQNVTKLIRDFLLFCYIIGQYYTFEYDIIYRLVGFEFFIIFALPLILEGWMANSPNYFHYLIKFYALYTPLFFNQFLLHENRIIQTIFFFAIIEIPSMVHTRQDKVLPEIKMDSYIFKLVQLPYARIAILHCTKKQTNDTNQIELAIACIRSTSRKVSEHDSQMSESSAYVSSSSRSSKYMEGEGIETFDEWLVIKRIAVCANTSDLNYIEKTNTLVISSCSDLKIYNASNLQLLKVINHQRPLKRLSFMSYDKYYSYLKKVSNSQTMIHINDSIFNTTASQHIVPQDIQPDIIKFIKYVCSFNMIEKYVYMCVPSDRLNCLIIVDVKDYERKVFLSSSNIQSMSSSTDLMQQHSTSLSNQEIHISAVKSMSSSSLNLKDYDGDNEFNDYEYLLGQEEESSNENDDDDIQIQGESEEQNLNEVEQQQQAEQQERIRHKTNQKRQSRNKQLKSKSPNQMKEINLYEYISKNQPIQFADQKSEDGIREYVIDCSAIKDILVHEHLLVISCSENIVFFDLQLRKIVKKISTLNFDTRVHWIRITPQFTYYLISNEIRAWIAKQSNKLNDFTIIQHFNFYDIQYILENKIKNSLYVIYNNTLYKQKIAVIDLSIYC